MRFARYFAFFCLVMQPMLQAKPPPGSVLTPPPPPPQNSILNRPPQPGVWQQIQPELNRSMGRIIDEPTYQLEHLQGPIPSGRFKRFMEERDRQMQLDQRALQQAPRTREEMDRLEYELFMRGGFPSASMQVMADEQALNNAKSLRDKNLIDAQNTRADALRERPNDREQIERDYQQKLREIRRIYEIERERILGYSPPAPTTQP